jgi:hypothetical protein
VVGRLRTAATALAVAALAAGCAGGDDPPSPRLPPQGVRADVKTDTTTARDGLVRWRSTWVLSWAPAPGARDYLIYVRTAEGEGGAHRPTTMPQWRIEVANGVNRHRRVPKARDQQLALVAAQVAVSVAARYPDGRIGPRSRPFPVGEHAAGAVTGR